LQAATEAAPPGAIAVQLREKDLKGRELYELARAVGAQCAAYETPLLISDRIDLALAVEADGVHLTGTSFNVTDARRLLSTTRLIGVSTHQPAEVAAAAAAGADFAVYGPVYAPLSKAAVGAERGPAGFGAALRASRGLPLYALGGITAQRIGELGGTAALFDHGRPAGVAVIGAVFGVDNPGAATCELLSTLAAW
jgi:thiamine-phosphate pyrophosphorylase